MSRKSRRKKRNKNRLGKPRSNLSSNSRGKFAFEVLEQRIMLAGDVTPQRPLLIVPDAPLSGPAAGAEQTWISQLGVAPEKLELDPVSLVYAPLIDSLDDVGYTPGEDLIAAPYDWRLSIAPKDTGVDFDGHLDALTANALLDGQFDHSVDYLGHWLREASDAWLAKTGTRPTEVDIAAHGVGAILVRGYIQSDAYQAVTNEGWTLPGVHDLTLIGAPNRGTVSALNHFDNDFATELSTEVTPRVITAATLSAAYKQYQAGVTIVSPDADLIPNENLSEDDFLGRYYPGLSDQLPTFDYVGVENGPGDQLSSSLLWDLNDGLDADFSIEEWITAGSDEITVNGTVHNANRFVELLGGDVSMLSGIDQPTATHVELRIGNEATGLILPFSETTPRAPAVDESWNQQIIAPGSSLPGDGLVTIGSSLGQFASDPDPLVKTVEVTQQTGDSTRLGIVADPLTLREILRNSVADPTTITPSPTTQRSPAETAVASAKLGLLEIDRLTEMSPVTPGDIADLQAGLTRVSTLIMDVTAAVSDAASLLDDLTGTNVGNSVDEVGKFFEDVSARIETQLTSLAGKFTAISGAINNVTDSDALISTLETQLTAVENTALNVVGGLVDLQSSALSEILGPLADGQLDPQRELIWRINRTTDTAISLPLALGKQLGIAGLEIDGQISASVILDIDVEFGLRLDDGSANAGRFFFRILKMDGSVVGQSNTVSANLDLGPLGATVTGGVIDLDIGFNVRLSEEGDQRLRGVTINDLQTTPPAELIQVTPHVSIDANLPIDVTLGSFSRTGALDIETVDGLPQASLSGVDELLGFGEFDIESIIDSLGSIDGVLQGLAASSYLDVGVPFANATAGELIETGLDIAAQLRDVEGNATVSTVQGLALELASILGVDPSAIGLDFVPLDHHFVLSVNSARTISPTLVSFDGNFEHAFVELSSNGNLSVAATIDTGFDFILDTKRLSATIEATQDAPLDGLFDGTIAFEIAVGPVDAVTVSFTASSNTSINDWVVDLQSGLDAAGLAGSVIAAANGSRLTLTSADGEGGFLVFAADENDPAVTELGFPISTAVIDYVGAHAFVENVHLDAGIGISGEIGGTASIGLASVDGRLAASGQIDVGISINDGNRIAVLELANTILTDPSSVLSGQWTGEAGIDVSELVARGGFDFVLPNPTTLGPDDVQIDVNLTGLSDTNPTGVIAVTLNESLVGNLASFKDFTFDDFLSALESLAQTLIAMGGDKLQGTTIPIIGVSIGELLDLGADISDLVAELRTANADGALLEVLQTKITQALAARGISFDTLDLDVQGKDILFAASWNNQTTTDVDLNLDLSALGLPAGTLLSVESDEKIEVTSGAEFDLIFGIDLSTTATPQPYLRGDSGLKLTAEVFGTGLDIDITALNVLPLFIRGGQVILDTDGTDGGDNEPARFAIDVGTTAPGDDTAKHYLFDSGSLQLPPLAVVVEGGISLDLPMFLPNESSPLDDGVGGPSGISGNVESLKELLLGNTGPFPGNVDDNVEVTAPDFAAVAGNLDLDDAFQLLVNGIQKLLPGLANSVNKIFETPLPLIGSSLSDLSEFDFVGSFLPTLTSQLQSELDSAGPTKESIRAALQSALQSVVPGSTVTLDPTSPVTEALFQIHLGALIERSILIGENFGPKALGIEVDGAIDVDFTWAIDLGLGISTTDGFFVEVDPNQHALSVALDVGFAPGTTLTGKLGFLELELTDTGTMLAADLEIDLLPGMTRVTFAQLVAGEVDDVLDVSFGGNAVVDVHAELGTTFAGGIIPSLATDFDFAWTINESGVTLEHANFTNAQIDVGELFSSLADEFFDTVDDVLDPLKPLIRVLDRRLPVLSDFDILVKGLDANDGDGRVTIVDMAERLTGFDPVFFDTLSYILTLRRKIDVVATAAASASGSLMISLGDLTLPTANLNNADGLASYQLPTFAAFDPSVIQDPAVADAATEFVAAQTAPDGSNFFFPLLNDPASFFGLLLGRDVPLLGLDIAPLKIGFALPSFRFPILGPLFGRLGGRIDATADLAFGYDTAGIRDFAAADYAASESDLLLNGLFIYDRVDSDGKPSLDPNDNDIDELSLSATVSISAVASAGFAEVFATGFVKGELGFDLVDADNDGAVRYNELHSGCFVEPSGSLIVGLKAGFKIKFPFPIPDIKRSTTLANVTLIDISGSCSPHEVDNLATLDNGELILNIDSSRSDEVQVTIDEKEVAKEIVDEQGETVDVIEKQSVYRVWKNNRFQDFAFADVTSISGNAGGGNDIIFIDPDINVPVTLTGGTGDDVLVGGGGVNQLDGGDGDDQLHGGPLADFLQGGDGNDVIAAGEGDDIVWGGGGDDLISGGSGNDVIRGDAGVDEIYGDEGDDTLDGNDGNDKLFGGAGRDHLKGQGGEDILVGGPGKDRLEGHGTNSPPDDNARDYLYGDTSPGEDGVTTDGDDDELFGDGGDDVLHGDEGDDTLDSGTGDDELFGGTGDDTLHGRSGDDRMLGDAGDDLLSGDEGNDYLHGGYGDDQLQGFEGADEIEGGYGDDRLYGYNILGIGDDSVSDILRGGDGDDFLRGQGGNDFLYGDGGNDDLGGGDGDDFLDGQSGNDLIDGGSGNDTARGGDGIDHILGQAGDDVLHGDFGNDLIEGGPGSDILFGGVGDDYLYGHAIDVTNDDGASDVIYGDQGIGHIFGETTTIVLGGRDFLFGQGGNDQLFGEQGRDDLFGGAGDDSLDGGDDVDLIDGGIGDDTASGGAGDDEIFGRVGDDNLSGNEGSDRIHGGKGDDTIDGGAGPDVLLGEAGADTIHGGDDDDQINGGAGEDELFGDAGNDLIVAGTGVVNVLRGGEGDDHLIGSDWGDEDPDPLDSVWFGDRLFGDAGNDTIEGLGGADDIDGGDGDDWIDGGANGDKLFGGAGNDTVYGGSGDDLIDGSLGNDKLFGETGEDTITGAAGADFIDGGTGTDLLDGGSGDDHLQGGGGVGDVLLGGTGADRLEGSPDGADDIDGGDGDDWLQGHGGNDLLRGGDGSDRVEGGDGDDTIEGGLGADILVGGSDHDLLYGHTIVGINDDGAIDYLYGDAANSSITVGAGRDQLFGGGGNDLLYGEGDDDFIDPGTGSDDRIDYGTGEATDPTAFVPPMPTPAPAILPALPALRTAATLKSGPAEAGRWAQLGNSASGQGISGRVAVDAKPTLTIDPVGRQIVAWSDNRNGDSQIFVSRYENDQWNELGGSASNGGVSRSQRPSSQPQIIVSDAGQPIVAWLDGETGSADVMVAAFDSTSETWLPLDDSLAVGGISGSANVLEVVASESPSGPVVAWIAQTVTTREIYVRVFDGSTWQNLGSAVAVSGDQLTDLAIAIDDNGNTAVAWSDSSGSSTDVYARRLVAGSWQALSGSDTGGGISDSVDAAVAPTIAWHGGELFVAWQQTHDTEIDTRTTIQTERFDGTVWLDSGIITGSSSITSGFAESRTPRLVAGTSLDLVWIETLDEVDAAKSDTIYRMRYSAGNFSEPFAGANDAAGSGVLSVANDLGGTTISSLAVGSDPLGNPAIVWTNQSASSADLPAIYLRSEGATAANRYRVASVSALESLLSGGTLAPGDLVLLAAGDYSQTLTLSAAASGVHFQAEPATKIEGMIIVDGAADVSLQDLNAGTIQIASGNNVTLRDSQLSQLVLLGGSGHRITNNRIEASETAIAITGNIGVMIGFNEIVGETAVKFDAVASVDLRHNRIEATLIGIDIAFDQSGIITGNDVRSGSIAVRYQADANVSGNLIHQSTYGVQVGPGLDGGVVTFGGVAGSSFNIIRDNVVGVDVRDRVVGQHLIANQTGAVGNGQLGDDDWQRPNRIELNEVGSLVTGTVQYNQFVDNTIAIKTFDKQLVAHNTISSLRDEIDSIGIHASSATGSRIFHNTIHERAGDAIRIVSSSSEIEVRSNVLWVDNGTALYVDDSSQSGFASDYNQLHAEPGATLVHYSIDFFDLLDWQVDVGRYDLHSIGTTVVNPFAAKPRVISVATGDYSPAPLIGQQSDSSPGIDAADPKSDLALSLGTVNLLTNSGFESGLANWNTNVEAGTGGTAASSFEGQSHFVPGATPLAFAEQTADLIAAGYTPAELDSSDLRIVFGGRLRHSAVNQVSQSLASVEFLNGGGTSLGPRVVSLATQSADGRWELVGDEVDIPVGARQAVFRYEAARTAASGANAGRLDNAWMRVVSETHGTDTGAYGNTALDRDVVVTRPTINLRFPDLYTDWERDRPRDILWDSYGNVGESAVRISLMSDGPHGAELVTVISATTADDGHFTWIPSTSGVDYATYGLRIEVQLVSNDYAFDRSIETFTVPENTDTFYANDQSLVDDQYTSAAGDNRNTGKLADRPKPTPSHIFQTYSLGSGQTLFTDDGDYALFDPLVISNIVGVGDDEGFVWNGPDAPGSTASLYHVHPNTVASLVELNDADFVTIRNLTLDNAQRGLYLHAGSTQFTGEDLSLSGHNLDGIFIEEDSEATVLRNLTVTNNGRHGIYVTSAIDEISGSVVQSNVNRGIYVTNQEGLLLSDNQIDDHLDYGIYFVAIAGDASTISGNTVSGTDRGIFVQATFGSVEVRENHVFDNRVDGIEGFGDVLVVRNAVHDNVGRGIFARRDTDVTENVVFSNATGIQLDRNQGSGQPSTATNNRVYNNTTVGILAYEDTNVLGNVVYNNPTGIFADSPHSSSHFSGQIANNVLYANSDYAIRIDDGQNPDVLNNTIHQDAGIGIRIETGTSGAELKNNILSLADAVGLSVTNDSQSGFQSDFNLFHLTGASVVGIWQNINRSNLLNWRSATFADQSSTSQDPRFVDPVGADGVIGYVDATIDGRDDDFHLQSTEGRFTGSLAPVFDVASGQAIFLTTTEVTDLVQSPAIDRGQASSLFGNEPIPSGGFINLGAHGNTSQASKSPAQYVLVTQPDGGEALPVGQTLTLSWRTESVGTGTVMLNLLRDGDPGFNLVIASSTPNDGFYDWLIDASVPAANDYRLEVTRIEFPGIVDISNNTFEITPETSTYYVNIVGDSDLSDNEYTTAAGDEANSGLSPGSPKPSVRSLLEAFDLEAGDTILVDTGVYDLTANIVLTANDSGVRIVGAVGTGHETILDRGNTATGSYVILLEDADDVTLESLSITGGSYGVITSTSSDSDNLTILNSRIYENTLDQIRLQTTDDGLTVQDSEVFGIAGTNHVGISASGSQVTLIGNDVHTNDRGIHLFAIGATPIADLTVTGNTVHDNTSHGIWVNSNNGATISENVTYANATGINAFGNGLAGFETIIENNQVYDNSTGITGQRITIRNNTIWSNTNNGISLGSFTGISGLDIAENNVVFDNTTGIFARGDSIVRGNVAYNNSNAGIFGAESAVIVGNTAYANDIGVTGAFGFGSTFTGQLSNNIVYDNHSYGIVVGQGVGALVNNNTVYQPAGIGIQVGDSSSNTTLRNNIIQTNADAAIEVTSNSQNGFSSNFNLIYTPGAGTLGRWGATDFDNRADWFYELGLDANSLAGETTAFDPQFVDVDGLDGILGYVGGVDGGLDDDFHLQTTSPAIDGGFLDDPFGNELGANGGRINVGAYGNTAEAATSPPEVIQVLSPNGLEKYESGQQITIDWHQHGDFNESHEDAYRLYVDSLGPVASWQFEESAGATVAIDQVGDRDGTYLGNPTLEATGAFGTALGSSLSFDGVDDELQIPDDGTLDLTHNVSLSFWMNVDQISSSFAATPLVSKDNSGVFVATYSISLTRNGALQMQTREDTTTRTTTTANSLIQAGQWYHVLGVMDRDLGRMTIYVDGLEQASNAISTTVDANSLNEPLRVGHSGSTFEPRFNGRIDELSLFDHPLTAHDADSLATPRAADLTLELVDAVTLATVETIVSNTQLLGRSYDWTIPTSVPADQEYLIKITAENALGNVSDLSNEPFQIANDGNQYYVNLAGDADLTDNEYTTAPGSNANTGKSPDSPLSSLRTLLSAYELGLGDTILVDTGVYDLTANIVLTANDSGVRIVGAVGTGHETILDRGNTATGSYVILLEDADDVTLESLSITGGSYGVITSTSSDSDNLTILNSRIYENTLDQIRLQTTDDGLTVQDSEVFGIAGTNHVGISASGSQVTLIGNDVHTNDRGIHLFAIGATPIADLTVTGNTVHDNTSHGIWVNSNNGATISENVTYANATGINAFGNGLAGFETIIENNQVYDNSTGITGQRITIRNNTIWSNTNNGISLGSFTGISGLDIAENNVVFDNTTGIFARGDSIVRGNVAYNNSNAGIFGAESAVIVGNTAYANDIGVTGAFGFGSTFTGQLSNNIVYDNHSYGIVVGQGVGALVNNNTVYQPAGIGIQVGDSSSNTTLRNNIIQTNADAAIEVTSNSQNGFSSNFNLIYTPGAGTLGRWGATDFDNRADWFYELGLDANSLAGETTAFDPQFVDVDGLDGILGYVGGVDGGLDDDFHLQTTSPAIDGGFLDDPFGNELGANGGRINVGAYGNTAEAATSPPEVIQVLSPNGLEKYESGQQITIDWHQHGDFNESHEDAYRLYVDSLGPVASWQFEESAGATVAIDQVGDRDGTYLGNPTLEATGAFGTALGSSLSFDGVDDELQIPDDGTLDLTHNVSLSFWMNVDQISSSFAATPLVSKDNSGVFVATYSISLTRNGALQMQTREDTTTRTTTTANSLIQAGQWYHVLGVMDRDLGRMTIYVDGLEQASNAISTTVDANSLNEPLRVGHSGSTFEPRFNGRIDELSLFDHPLTAHDADSLATPRAADLTLELVDAVTLATVETIVSNTQLLGRSYDWTIPTSVPADQEYLIKITAENALGNVSDLSNEPFQIANDGNQYYVNLAGDADLTDNEYTTAPGSNANTGKSPGSPMADLGALLAVYDLEPGDVVNIDTGEYAVLRNIDLTENDSGVRLQGATEAGHATIFNRGSTLSPSYGFYFIGADDITLDSLEVTGGYYGILAATNSGSTNNQLINSRIYNNAREEVVIGAGNDSWIIDNIEVFDTNNSTYNGLSLGNAGTVVENSSFHDVRDGIAFTGSGATIRNNAFFDNANRGIYVSGSSGDSLIIESNQVFGNTDGIDVRNFSSSTFVQVIGNHVFDNSSDGILASGQVLVFDNQAHGNVAIGIYGTNEAVVDQNVVHANAVGIQLGGPGNAGTNFATATENRVFDNATVGILAYYQSDALRNSVYSNSIGIQTARGTTSQNYFQGTIADNLVYANTNQGILVHYGRIGAEVINNTVFQAVGEALRIENDSQDVRIANNVLWVDSGHDLFVADDSQSGLTSDYNLFHTGTASNAFTGSWGGQDFASLADWQTASGLDTNSYEGDPLFIDRDGADNVLGWDPTGDGYDGGPDDNFIVHKNSPTIDSGLSWLAFPTDLQGSTRLDDPSTVNRGVDYVEQSAVNTAFPPAAGEVAQNWKAFNGFWNYVLPFNFTFYGVEYTDVTVSSHGLLQFGATTGVNSSFNSTSDLLTRPRIAPLWDSMTTLGTGDDIFIDESQTGRVTIRWDASANAGDANFAVTLFDTGDIEFHYGSGNAILSPTVGISAGDGRSHLLAIHDGQTQLTDAASVRFALVPGSVDIGAYEFRGDSNDNLAPTVTGTGPSGVQSGTIIESTDSIRIDFSEEINQIDALAPAAYELRSSGANGIFGDGDDSVITLLPEFVVGDTSVRLNFVDGLLPAGNYRLTLYSNTTASQHDTAGIRLDGDSDGVTGGDYVRLFEVAMPTADSADFDSDGDVDGADFLAWQRGFGTPGANKPDGDADNDNDVDTVDLVVWAGQYGELAPLDSADFDSDGDVDGADFLAWQRGFGTPGANKPDGDADNDNDVDTVDLVVWAGQYGELAPLDSADFDSDGDVDGADFLAWQRGFGTPGANKPDGDADNDNDVDTVDLVVWADQYGELAPLDSAVSDQPPAFLAPQNDLAPQNESSAVQTPAFDSRADLIDAVMAFELGRGRQVSETLPLDREPVFVETYADRVFAAESITTGPLFTDESERIDTSSSENEEAKAQWLADELLERVFD